MELNTAQLLAVEYAIAVLGLFLGYKCISLKKDNMNYFMRFVYILNAFLLVNIPIRHIELHLVTWNRMLVFVLYAFSVIVMNFTAAYWCLFVLKQFNSKIVSDERKIFLFLLPAGISVPLCVINYWTGWLYVIDEASCYSRGSVFILQSVLSYYYIVIIAVCSLIHLIQDKEKETARKCCLSTMPSLIGAALQIIYGGSFLLIGIVLTGIVMYTEICLSRQKAYELSEAVRSINDELLHSNRKVAENMRTILALSDIYYALLEVNLEEDTFKEIKAPDYLSGFCGQFDSAKECMSHIAKEMFDPAYTGLMSTFFDPDTINEVLKNKNSYFVDAKGYHIKEWVRITMIVVKRGDHDEVAQVVYAISDIGDIIEQQKKIEKAKVYELHALQMKELFIQTAGALASAIDAKDKYTHGHSRRVAEYARQIARETGKDEEVCENVYVAGLLHDVGKIGIKDAILNKTGKLTAEEFECIKQHPDLGNNILSGISSTPYLSVGAHYHHEKYNGSGYPSGLKGEEIPELARIIAVADAYDAMTSSRSYRTPLAQPKVREELVKGIGTQFDPEFAAAMIHMMDADKEYKLRDQEHLSEGFYQQYTFEEKKKQCTDGIRIQDHLTRITFSYEAILPEEDCLPSIVVFDSLDGQVYTDDANQNKMEYTDFCDISFQGDVTKGQIRTYQLREYANDTEEKIQHGEAMIEAVRQRDHMLIKLYFTDVIREYTIAFRDRSQYSYLAITGKQCIVNNFRVYTSKEQAEDGSMNRIAEEISYIQDQEEGDLGNLEIAGLREKHSDGILLENKLDLSFHTKCLPAARRLWHCPFIVFFTSRDGMVYGDGYRELAIVRCDGESYEKDAAVSNKMEVSYEEGFVNLEEWKRVNREGVDCTVHIEKRGNEILLKAKEGGIKIYNTTTISEEIPELYCAITGDQVAITAIRVKK